MADISKITLPNGSKYNIKDSTARTESVTSASISGSGLLEFRNAAGNLLFTLQLPLYPLYIPFTSIADFFARSTNQISSLSVVVGPPTQDLHGYSSPWPAGGGVSKCPSFANGTHTMTNGLTVTIQDGEITINGTASGSGYYEESIESTVMPADAYVSFNNPVGTYNIAYVFINGSTQIAAPSLYPANGTKQPTGLSGATVNRLRIFCNAGTYDNFKMSPIVHDGSTPQAWKPYANICPISGRSGLNVYVSPTEDIADATTYAVAFGDAGTVYGGTVDVVSGVLTVTWVKYTDFSSGWSRHADGYFQTISINKKPGQRNVISDILKTVNTNQLINTIDAVCGRDTDGRVFIHPPETVTTSADFEDYMSGHYLVYELATPQTYQLTPQTVAALVGQNYIWADTGDISITFYYSELLPLATPNDNGKVLMVVNGAWNKVNLPVYNGGAN